MTALRRLALWAAGTGRPEVRLARTQLTHDRAVAAHARGEDERRFASIVGGHAARGHLNLGTTATGTPYLLEADRLGGQHVWLSGATGSGKSRLAAAIVDEVVGRGLRGEPVATSLVDFKGDLSDVVARAFTARVASLPARARERALGLFTVFQPFGDRVQPCQLLAREPSVSLLTQAATVVEVLEAAARLHTGPRQSDMLQAVLAAAIGEGLSLVETRFLLEEPARLREIALRCAEPTVRVYAHERLSRENARTTDGLSARFDTLLGSEPVRAALAGPGALDLRRCFRPGALSIFDFATGAPFGAEAAVRTLGALIICRLAWAVFDATRTRDADLLLAGDEIQVGLTPGVEAALERVVTLGRSYGVGLLSAHQTVAQLPTYLRSILSTNVRVRIIGRGSREDAEASKEWLPITGEVARPGQSDTSRRTERAVLTETEETRRRVREIEGLGNRFFLASERPRLFVPRYFQSRDFDPPSWSDFDPGLVREVRSAYGVPRDLAYARARAIEEEAAARILARSPDDTTGRRGRRRTRPFTTPDAVAAHDALEGPRREVP